MVRRRPWTVSAIRTAQKVAKGVGNHLLKRAASSAESAAKRAIDEFWTPSGKRQKITMTPKGTIHVSKRSGAASSKMAGFIKRGRRYKRSRRNKMSLQGVNLVKEAGGIVDAKKVSYIGHSDAPLVTVRRIVWMAVCKKLHEKIYGVSPENVDAAIMSPSDDIYLTYALNGTNYTYNYNSGAAYISVLQMADLLADEARSFYTIGDQVNFIRLDYVPGAAVKKAAKFIRLLDSTITLNTKASLKIQNRSANALGTEADEVDNIPLSGYSYGGPGSGAVFKSTTYSDYQMICDNQKGVIAYAANTSAGNALQEPPLAGDFAHVVRTGKIRLNPGDIKTSNLSSVFRRDFNSIMSTVLHAYKVNAKSITGFGKYRLFALEKMIETDADASAQPSIKVAYEQNIRMLCVFREKYAMNTVQRYEYN